MATKEELLAQKAALEKKRELLARKAELETKRASLSQPQEKEFQTPGIGFGAGLRQFAEENPELPLPIIPTEAPSLPQIAQRIPKTIGASAGAAFEGVKEAVTSPKQTIGTLANIIKGGALAALPGQQGGRRELHPFIARTQGQPEITESPTEAEIRAKGFDPFVELVKGRVARPGFTAAEDPFGALLDLTGVGAGGAATAFKLAPTASKAAKVANAVKKAADATNPIVLPLKAIKGGIDLGGKTLGIALELTTGTGAGTVKKALRGSPDLQATLRGNTTGTDIVSMAKASLNEMKDQRAFEYRQILDQIDQSTVIDIAPVRAALDGVLKKFRIPRNKDGSINLDKLPVEKAEKQKLKDVIKIVDEWGSDPKDFSPAGMDDLKQIIDSYTTSNSRAQSIKSTIRTAVFDSIANKVPEYKTMTSKYAQASKEIENIDKTLALGDKKAPETALRKLMSVAKKDEEFKVNLIKIMEERTGVNIQDAIAGLSLSSFRPQGFIGTSTAAGTGAAVIAGVIDPKMLVLLAASSPKLVGEFLVLLGTPIRGLKAIDKQGTIPALARAATSQPATQAAFQAGRVQENIPEQAPDNILQRRLRDTTIAPF